MPFLGDKIQNFCMKETRPKMTTLNANFSYSYNIKLIGHNESATHIEASSSTRRA